MRPTSSAPPLSAGWYLSVGLFLAQSAAPAALALFVLARRSPWPAGALLAAALIAFRLDAGSVRGALLYKVTDIATTAIALLCIVPLWQRRSRLTLAVAISLLIVMVLSVGAVAHAVDFADTRIWRVHMAAEVTVFMLAAAFYLRRIVRNGEAS